MRWETRENIRKMEEYRDKVCKSPETAIAALKKAKLYDDDIGFCFVSEFSVGPTGDFDSVNDAIDWLNFQRVEPVYLKLYLMDDDSPPISTKFGNHTVLVKGENYHEINKDKTSF